MRPRQLYSSEAYSGLWLLTVEGLAGLHVRASVNGPFAPAERSQPFGRDADWDEGGASPPPCDTFLLFRLESSTRDGFQKKCFHLLLCLKYKTVSH